MFYLIHTRSLYDTYGNLGNLLKVTNLVISGFGVNLGMIYKTYALRKRIVTKGFSKFNIYISQFSPEMSIELGWSFVLMLKGKVGRDS